MLKCWRTSEPSRWDGVHWKGKEVLCLPKPVNGAGMPMAIASDNPDMVRLAAERGYIVLSSFIESALRIRARNSLYASHARLAGHSRPLKNCSVARAVYIAGSRQEAIEDMRAAVTVEVAIQAERGFLDMLKSVHGLDVPNDSTAIDYLVGSGLYVVGDPDEVAAQLKAFYDDCGGFGVFLITTGKDWAARRSAPARCGCSWRKSPLRMRSLEPADLSDVEG